jgi:Thymidylate synthase
VIIPTDVACPFGQVYTYLGQRLRHAPEVSEPPHQMERLRDDPRWVTRELANVVFQMQIPSTLETLTKEVRPNLPWAETHFRERVSGEPLNPPPSHVDWPYAQAGNDEHLTDGKFSHTYPERMWPRRAPGRADIYAEENEDRRGIRYTYGDLQDLVYLLINHPHTRQAYLPIWFPEDLTAANFHRRVPCTLGYHFLMRKGKLHMTYFIRSCDFVRYLRDDVYMACRLCQWVLAACGWGEKKPGNLTMHIVSLHCFEGDLAHLKLDTRGVKLANRQA